MSTVWFLWHGGASYTAYVADHTEEASSMAAVLDICRNRYDNRDGSTPCVSDDSGAAIYFTDPREDADPYPERFVIRTDRGRWRLSY